MTKATAHLRDGGQVEITLPLDRHEEYPGWRVDQNGVLLNMQHVSAITFVPAEPTSGDVAGKKLVALIDRDGYRWMAKDGGFVLLGEDGTPLSETVRQRNWIEAYIGPVAEVWE